MTTFVQFHILTPYTVSNPNRDDAGNPKQAVLGGAPRLRLSSQSVKRAVRESSYFASDLAGNRGTRTKRIHEVLRDKLVEDGASESEAAKAAEGVAQVFGKLETAGKDTPNVRLGTTLAFVSPDEWALAHDLAAKILAGEAVPKEKDVQKLVLRHADCAVDIAMFGRMLAGAPDYNRDAAVQVSHAFTTHRALAEGDFFSAVDDLKTREEDSGAGHIGELGFGSGLYYLYACVNVDLMIENLAGDRDLAAAGLDKLAHALAIASPGGKRASFGQNPRATFIRAERGSLQPRDLSGAFFKPVAGGDLRQASVDVLNETADKLDRAYGMEGYDRAFMDVEAGEGSLAEIAAFAAEAARG